MIYQCFIQVVKEVKGLKEVKETREVREVKETKEVREVKEEEGSDHHSTPVDRVRIYVPFGDGLAPSSPAPSSLAPVMNGAMVLNGLVGNGPPSPPCSSDPNRVVIRVERTESVISSSTTKTKLTTRKMTDHRTKSKPSGSRL